MILGGVGPYKICEPLFEGIRVIMSYRGERYSPEYIQGISGAAFRIGGICPCAPTCGNPMTPQELIGLLGYEYEEYSLSGEGIDPNKKIAGMVERVKAEIRNNRPVLVWHAFTNAEWDVVCGYDDAGRAFLGRGSYAGLGDLARADETRAKDAVEICPAFGAIIIKDKIGSPNEGILEKAALKQAVSHAGSQMNAERLGTGEWVFLEGLACYRRWVEDYRNPSKTKDIGDSYCIEIYRSTHRAASKFLSELAQKYPGSAHYLTEASTNFAAEADLLDACAPLLGWGAPTGPDADRNVQVSGLLDKAQNYYSKGISAIETALQHM